MPTLLDTQSQAEFLIKLSPCLISIAVVSIINGIIENLMVFWCKTVKHSALYNKEMSK